MTKTHLINPSISAVLDDFFSTYKPDAPANVRQRIDLVRSDLASHLEAEGPRVLTTSQLAILGTEKQFSAETAFARTMHAAELYYALEHYLDHVHAQLGIEQREVQLDVIAALAAGLWRDRLISEQTVSECCIIEFDLALRRGRDRVAAARKRERLLK